VLRLKGLRYLISPAAALCIVQRQRGVAQPQQLPDDPAKAQCINSLASTSSRTLTARTLERNKRSKRRHHREV